MIEPISVVGWILAVLALILAYYYYRQSRHAHEVLLEYKKASQSLEDDWRRTGERRGIIKFRKDGMPHIAWQRGGEMPPRERCPGCS